MNGWVSKWVKSNCPTAKSDLCTCFFERGQVLATAIGYISMITASSWMFISSFEKFRKSLLSRGSICSMIQQSTHGYAGVTVPTTMFAYACSRSGVIGSYIRLEDFDRPQWQEPRALEALADPDCGWFYRADASGFEAIPGSPIAYWASASTLTAFENPLLGDLIPVKKGLDTGDNDTFLRLWYEVSISKMKIGSNNQQSFVASRAKWAPHDKGGEYRRWYGNKEWIINWENNGSDLKASSANLRSERYYFHNAITWSSLSSGLCSFRLSDYGAISNTAGSSMFPGSDALLYLALMNSSIVQYLLEFLAPTLNYSAGPVGQVPRAEFVNRKTIETLANDSVANAKQDWDAYETSWDFKCHPLI